MKQEVPAARIELWGKAEAHDRDEEVAGRSPDPMSINDLGVFLAFGYDSGVYFREGRVGRVERRDTVAIVHLAATAGLLPSLIQVLQSTGIRIRADILCRDDWVKTRISPDVVLPPGFKNERPGELTTAEVIEWSLHVAVSGNG